jgi:hypothetical protein
MKKQRAARAGITNTLLVMAARLGPPTKIFARKSRRPVLRVEERKRGLGQLSLHSVSRQVRCMSHDTLQNEQIIHSLAKRLEGVERLNRRMKKMLVSVVCVLLAMVSLDATPNTKISKAQGFEVIDSSGHMLAKLDANTNGPSLIFLGPDGTATLQVGTVPGNCQHPSYPAACAPGLFNFRPDRSFERNSLLPSAPSPLRCNG